MFPPLGAWRRAQTVRPACCSTQSPTTLGDRVERGVGSRPAAVAGGYGEPVVGTRHHHQPAARAIATGPARRGCRTGRASPAPPASGSPTAGQLVGTRALGTTGRVQRERERQHADRAHLPGGAAGDPCAGAASADDQRGTRPQLVAHARRSHVEHRRGGRATRLPATRHGCSTSTTVMPRRGSSWASRCRSDCLHPAAGAVPEHQRRHAAATPGAGARGRPVRRRDGADGRAIQEHRRARRPRGGAARPAGGRCSARS